MIVPLVARGRVLGTISVSILRSSGRDPLDREDVAFGMEVATHAAMALDNARLYEQQRDIAAILQQALLPRSLPEVAGAEVAVRHRPGRAGTEVGGDFYDLFEAGDRWIAVVGDVCGKGPEAAALTSLVRHTLRATARLGPALAVERVHEAIQASGENTYCTLCCAEIRAEGDGFAARVVTAGHPEPRVVQKDGGVQRLDVTGPLVGVLDDPVFEAQEVTLPSGATFFMCSDGVPEARRNGELFGDNRLERLLSRLSPLEPSEMLQQPRGGGGRLRGRAGPVTISRSSHFASTDSYTPLHAGRLISWPGFSSPRSRSSAASSPASIGSKIFEFIWGKFDDREPPEPEDRQTTWLKLGIALALQGAIFRLVRGAFDHGARRAFFRGTHTWPGRGEARRSLIRPRLSATVLG